MSAEAVARAPLRISLAGGGSDLPEYYSQHGCHLLAAALDQHVEVRMSAAPRGVTVNDETFWTAATVEALPTSLTRCVLRRFGITDRIAVRTRSPCPSGSGLGWSGALTVALVGAASAWCGHPLSPSDAASMAFKIEREDFGSPVGQQDQWAAALGGVVRLGIDQDGVVTVHREPELETALDGILDRCLLLFRTPMRRLAADMLHGQVARLMSEDHGAAVATAMRVITGLVGSFERAIADRDVVRLGDVLHTHWQAKVQASPSATTPEIDAWYRDARRAGAVGGKLIGAGGGGHLLVVSGCDRADIVVQALQEAGLTRIPIRLDRRGLVVVPSGRGTPGHER